MTGIDLIAAERARQIEEEGFTAEHDARHRHSELAWAAMHYVMPMWYEQVSSSIEITIYPETFAQKAGPYIKFSRTGDRVRQLTIAGALIAAEIARHKVESA